MIYLTLEEALYVAERAIGAPPVVRDLGLLDSALARPATTLFGKDAYATLDLKVASLVHSLCTNHPLVDRNKRLSLAGGFAFAGMNGYRLDLTNDEAYELIMDVADGLADLDEIASRLVLIPRRR
ncbi:type II toxin-antitoxin system death-on-curing family toxin [Spongisporangium articulatum]|uniref:Type II toxin-antitoxin system death-on-curing family toxin n=1 Tax=Spongisporangium articulatum TaxID=3362603 RepID=A0ABW8ALJ0_9ACTN